MKTENYTSVGVSSTEMSWMVRHQPVEQSLFDIPKSRATLLYYEIEMVRRTTFIYSSTCRKAEHVEQPSISKLQQQLNDIGKNANAHLFPENNIVVYPIPANQRITIEYKLDENETAEFIIYDVLGHPLDKIKLFGNVQKATMDVSHLAKGMYTYKLTTTSYNSYTGKLIID